MQKDGEQKSMLNFVVMGLLVVSLHITNCRISHNLLDFELNIYFFHRWCISYYSTARWWKRRDSGNDTCLKAGKAWWTLDYQPLVSPAFRMCPHPYTFFWLSAAKNIWRRMFILPLLSLLFFFKVCYFSVMHPILCNAVMHPILCNACLKKNRLTYKWLPP